MAELPKVLNSRIVARSRIFTIEQVSLLFPNGNQVEFERMAGSAHGAVLIIPVLEDSVLLVREYSAGSERYELGFPKGRIENDEDPLDAANREIQEEVGYAAGELEKLRTITLAPAYSRSVTHIVLARDLYPSVLQGDEPEPLEVVAWKLDNLDALLQHKELTEARSITCIYMLKELYQAGSL